MCDGLEVSEILKSELERTLRIDAEFYKKENLIMHDALNKINSTTLTNYFHISDGNHMSIKDNFSETGIKYYKGSNIYNFFIEDSNPICISENIYNSSSMIRSHLKQGDILLSIVGAIIGNVALVTTNEKQTCSCKLAILRPRIKKYSSIGAIYLKTKYGQNQIQKFRRGAAQTGLLLEDTDQLYIPTFSSAFITTIDDYVLKMYKISQDSKNKYRIAMSILLRSISTEHFIHNTDATIIKSFSDSFGASGRLDAEFYQKKYEAIENMLNGKTGRFTLHDTNFTPVSSTTYHYIELSDIGTSGNITGAIVDVGSALPTRARRKLKSGQVIVSSIEGSLGSCALVPIKYHDALCSTGFYIINSTYYNPETLLMLFKSFPIQELMKKRCSGSILTAINKEDFLDIPLPDVDGKIQTEISDQVQQSFALRDQSEQILEHTIQAVELAIEESEDYAMQWLLDQNQ